MNENSTATMSFDRMRNMLVRAAEIRESEQQQIFDALDEIHARMSPLESVGAIRKRLAEVPDRNELAEVSQRLDNALSKLEATDAAIATVTTAVESIVDKLAKPFAQLDGRLDGMAGKMEGVVGRMDGLEDKLAHIHKRLDELDGHLDKQDTKLAGLPKETQEPLRERIDAVDAVLRERIGELESGLRERVDAAGELSTSAVSESGAELRGELDRTRESVTGKIDETRTQLDGKIDETRQALDSGERLTGMSEKLEGLGGRLDELTVRLNSVENSIGSRLGDLSGDVAKHFEEVRGTLGERPDTDSLDELVRNANTDSERRHAGQLDEAMATFAELILGGGPQATPPPITTAAPRQQQRRARGRVSSAKGKVNGSNVDENEDISESA